MKWEFDPETVRRIVLDPDVQLTPKAAQHYYARFSELLPSIVPVLRGDMSPARAVVKALTLADRCGRESVRRITPPIGSLLMQTDYSALELRVMAQLTRGDTPSLSRQAEAYCEAAPFKLPKRKKRRK